MFFETSFLYFKFNYFSWIGVSGGRISPREKRRVQKTLLLSV
jgi:DNA mismatch repair protein MutH